jgi:long-chain acyl-CoA synthetase
MSFLATIFERLRRRVSEPVLQEVRGGSLAPATGGDLLEIVRAARTRLARAGLRKGDRCALLAHNGIRWAALDLALMAEGIIVVPLYARQATAELVGMMKDAEVSLILCGDAALAEGVSSCWPEAPPILRLEEAVAGDPDATDPGSAPQQLEDSDPVTIIYTSGTSGEPKGVVLNAGNVSHMLRCTTARLDQLMGVPGSAGILSASQPGPDRPTAGPLCNLPARRGQDACPTQPEHVFHYLPFCFAGSWILLLSCLSRNALLSLSTDLSKLGDEIKLAAPDYFQNVPALLERMRGGIEEQMKERGGVVAALFNRAKRASLASVHRRDAKGAEAAQSTEPGGTRHAARGTSWDRLCLAMAQRALFPAIRKRISPRLRALICGSAPLSLETQLFFHMLGIPVLQVYGLTETTAICTMDDPAHVVPGRVGPAIPGIDMRLGENDEILVRGPNVFPGYWRRPQQTAAVFADGWFLTGDQGEVDTEGNWRIVGRVKNLIVLNSGHKVPPEPLEEALRKAIPGAQQVMLVGSRRGFLAAIVTGPEVKPTAVQAALEAMNPALPHYKRIHVFHVEPGPFTVESGLLTANGKLRREAIAERLKPQIDGLYTAAKGN